MIQIKQQGYYIEATHSDVASMFGWADDSFIHLIRGDVKQGHRRQGIMSDMIRHVQQLYPKAELSFGGLSRQGAKFVLASFPEAKVPVSVGGSYRLMLLTEYVQELDDCDLISIIKNRRRYVDSGDLCEAH